MIKISDLFTIPRLGGVLIWLMLFFVFGIGIIILFAVQSFIPFQTSSWSKFLSIVGVGILIAVAVFFSGIVIGFLFGIPRILPQEPIPSEPDIPKGAETRDKYFQSNLYEENSNLDQISDWLTKILVGVGLTQLNQVPAVLHKYSEKIEPSLGGYPSSGIFGIAILIFFSANGFLIGYLWTRRCAAVEFKKGLDELHERVVDLRKEEMKLKFNVNELTKLKMDLEPDDAASRKNK